MREYQINSGTIYILPYKGYDVENLLREDVAMSKLLEWALRFKPNEELYCLEKKW